MQSGLVLDSRLAQVLHELMKLCSQRNHRALGLRFPDLLPESMCYNVGVSSLDRSDNRLCCLLSQLQIDVVHACNDINCVDVSSR